MSVSRCQSLICVTRYCGAAIVVAALASSTAQAQTSPAQTPAAAPPSPPHTFSGSATVGVSLESGRTDLTGVQLEFEGKRAFTTNGGFDFGVSYANATAGSETVADRLTAYLDVEQNFRKRLVMMLRTQALRDPVAQIRYRFGEMAGFGVRLGDKRVQVRLLPGVAFLNDDMHVADDGFRFHYGLYEDITATITPAWTFTHFLSVSRDVSDRHEHITTIEAKLTGAVTRRVSIQLSYHYNDESILPPGVEPEYQKIAAGVQVSF